MLYKEEKITLPMVHISSVRGNIHRVAPIYFTFGKPFLEQVAEGIVSIRHSLEGRKIIYIDDEVMTCTINTSIELVATNYTQN